ncbi:tetratricopeptide repeat protein [Roseibium sediminis]|uniref:tetratricopeptide repeat protein n=1 Tax=Roseibium sediminis TaxID=1775174 RepID=UPI00123D6478|nr:tetratricopeptide repeat protein [Roseibium sediminis]
MSMRSAAQNTKPATTLDKLKEGLALQSAGDYDKAQRIYKQILKKVPNNQDALHLLGVSYRQQGFPKRAVDYIEKAIRIDPNQGAFYANLARAKSDIPNIPAEEVLELAEKALALDPRIPEANNLKALSLKKLDREDEARELLAKLVKVYPNHSEINRNYGVLLRDQQDYQAALQYFSKALTVQPDDVDTIAEMARCQSELKEYQTAENLLVAALKAFPTSGKLKHELARLYFTLSRNADGLPLAQEAVRDNSEDHQRQVTLAVIYLKLGNTKMALKHLTEAKRLTQGIITNIDWNISLTYLAMGDLEKGWDLHGNRLVGKGVPGVVKRRFPDHPVWQGEDISDKTILVWTDQGLGDTIKGGTMLPELIERAGNVIFEGPPKILDLFRRSFPQITCRSPHVTNDGKLHPTKEDFDYQVCSTDLARYFRRSLGDFKTRNWPVYAFDKDLASRFQQQLGDVSGKKVVGIGWRSKNLDAYRIRYYLSAPQFRPIIDELDDVVIVNLQYMAIQRELDYFKQTLSIPFHAVEGADLFDDMEAAAAVTALCDVVVSVTSSVADLAGALDVPTVRFGPFEPPFLLGQQNPPWYPSIEYMITDEYRPVEMMVPEIRAHLIDLLDRTPIEKRVNRLKL